MTEILPLAQSPEFRARMIQRHADLVQRIHEINMKASAMLETANPLIEEAEFIERSLGDLVPKEVTEG
jgi:hypothetical protein